MRLLGLCTLVILFIIGSVSGVSPTLADDTTVEKSSVSSRSIGSDERERGLMILGVPEPIAQGVHVNLGKAAEWVIDRSVKIRGWSFSGYSITTLDDNYGIRRWHFGIISGEMDVDAANSLIDRGIDAGSEYHDEFEWRRSQGIILGVRYTRTF